MALLGHRQKYVWMLRGEDRVNRDLGVALGAVLEPYGTGKARSELPMHLAFGGARTYGAPGDHISEVLWGNWIKVFGAGGKAEIRDVAKQRAPDTKSMVDIAGAVEMRVVEQPLPANGGTRLLEVHTHNEQEIVREALHLSVQSFGVDKRRFRIMDGAGANDYQEPRVPAANDVAYLVPRLEDHLRGILSQADLLNQVGWCYDLFLSGNACVIGDVSHGLQTSPIASISSLCSAAFTRASSVSAVSPGKTLTRL